MILTHLCAQLSHTPICPGSSNDQKKYSRGQKNKQLPSTVWGENYGMVKSSLVGLLLLLVAVCVQAQGDYDIKLTLKPFTHGIVYLGYYYGKIKAVADSAVLDGNSHAEFKGSQPLPGGIYFVVSPKKEILFEVLIDKEQHFSIAADSADLPKNIRFTGSPDNTLFQAYTTYMAKNGKSITDDQAQLARAHGKADSTQILDRIRKTNTLVQQFRDSIERNYPSSFLSALLVLLKEPQVPAAAKRPGGKYDTSYVYYYYRAHYWDGVSFTDERLIRTPIFEPKLDKYYKDLVPPQADSINREVDMMLLEARTSKEMFKYLLIHFVQKYINPEYMGQDAVFVHLFEKYINTGQAEFFTEKYRKFVNDRAYSLMANLIGQPAANLEMTDTLEHPMQLYDVEAPFIVICFWDPTCSHCKETVPKVDSIFQAKWKGEGIKVVGVMVDGGKENWLKFIHDHNLKDWIHVYQSPAQRDAEEASGKPGYRQLFDVYQTPILYLLDKDKRIVAKKLSYQQFDQVIDLKLKNAKSN